jgi:lactoylglutathione lyase
MNEGPSVSKSNPGVEMSITFVYFEDFPAAVIFYRDVLGFPIRIDQGWSKIFQVSTTGYIGLVDEKRGYHKASPVKPIILCFRVPDVDAWHRFLLEKGVKVLGEPTDHHELGIRAFFVQDTEGHVLEFQSAQSTV